MCLTYLIYQTPELTSIVPLKMRYVPSRMRGSQGAEFLEFIATSHILRADQTAYCQPNSKLQIPFLLNYVSLFHYTKSNPIHWMK